MASIEYWLDTNVFSEGMKGPYGFDIAPRFWEIIDELTNAGRLACPTLVYDELRDAPDVLKEWAAARRLSGLFVDPSEDVQLRYGKVVDYVASRYPQNQETRRFLGGSDPWLISHADAMGGKVVSLEQRVKEDSNKPKIPNVCDYFGVEYANTYEMLRELGVAWTA